MLDYSCCLLLLCTACITKLGYQHQLPPLLVFLSNNTNVLQNSQAQGSCCGTVDSMVASVTSGPRFESSYRQFLLNIFTGAYYIKLPHNKAVITSQLYYGIGPCCLHHRTLTVRRSISSLNGLI